MTFWPRHRLTGVTLLMAALVAFLAVAIALDADDTTAGRTTGGIVLGLCAFAILGGLWLLHKGRAAPVAYTLLVVGALLPAVGFFWMFLLSTMPAFIIVFFGVARGGLVWELSPAAAT